MSLQPGFSLDPVATYTQQTATAGMWSFPPPGVTPFDLSTAGVLYLNITAGSCQATSPVPDGRVIKTHHYFSKRPLQTYMYGEFDTLKWAAYIGMGNETVGTALAGQPSCLWLQVRLSLLAASHSRQAKAV